MNSILFSVLDGEDYILALAIPVKYQDPGQNNRALLIVWLLFVARNKI